MVFEIQNSLGEWVSILPYVAMDGLKYSRNDIDGPNAGRGLDGSMIRDRVASKIRWDITCQPLRSPQLSIMLSLIKPEFVTARFTDPETDTVIICTMYSNNIPAQVAFSADTETWWTGFTFPLIEK